jgi:hypothetical protein
LQVFCVIHKHVSLLLFLDFQYFVYLGLSLLLKLEIKLKKNKLFSFFKFFVLTVKFYHNKLNGI